MCVCTKRVCVSNTETKTCTIDVSYKLYTRILVFVQSKRVNLFIVNCILKNKFNIHVYTLFIHLSQHYKPNFHAKNIIWLKFTINYSLFKFNYNWRHCFTIPWLKSCCVSVPKECAYVITNSSAKHCDWLPHARPAQFPFPVFLFPDTNGSLGVLNFKFVRDWKKSW